MAQENGNFQLKVRTGQYDGHHLSSCTKRFNCHGGGKPAATAEGVKSLGNREGEMV
jgi:hypothetical protein